MRVAFVGEEAAGARALQRVIRSDHELAAVLTTPVSDAPGATVASVAADAQVPIIPAGRVRDEGLAEELIETGVDVLLNVHSLYVICPAVLAAARFGAFNLHPGPLPEYSGLNTPSWALVHGRERHGVTLHWMDPGIDTGDIVARTDFELTAADTGGTVSLRCAQEGLALIDDLLKQLSIGPESVPREPQYGERRYFGRDVPREGWIPWSASAREVLDFVRAFDYRPFPSPWGVPRTCADGIGEFAVERVTATEQAAARPPGEVHADDDAVFVATADDWVRVLRARVDGRARDPSGVLAHRTTLGT